MKIGVWGKSGQGQVGCPRTWVRADVHKSGRVRYYCGSPRMLDNPIGDVIQFRPILEKFYIFKDYFYNIYIYFIILVRIISS